MGPRIGYGEVLEKIKTLAVALEWALAGLGISILLVPLSPITFIVGALLVGISVIAPGW